MNTFRAAGMLLSAAIAVGCATAPNQPQTNLEIKIIAFNDYHGNLESPGTFAVQAGSTSRERPAVGGADFLAAHVAALKRKNPLNVVVGAGDAIGASPLISGAFHDEPAVETLNRIGLEFNAVGNHEFDKGLPELLRLQHGGCAVIKGRIDPHSCQGQLAGTPVPFEGAAFTWLGANVLSRTTGKPLLPPYGIKTFQGINVAFIGLTLKGTSDIVSPQLVSGIEFRDEADTINALIPTLRAQGIESIVVLLHEGGVQTGKLQDINGCDGNLADSPLAGIVARLDDAVDLVISGHTHAAYRCSLPNAAGRTIPVTSSGSYGRVLADINMRIDPRTRDVVAVNATNRLVTHGDPDVLPDATLGKIVAAYRQLVEPIARQVLGTLVHPMPAARIDAACNMPGGNLVADAQLHATRTDTAGGAQIAFINGGGVRQPGFPHAGDVTYGEAFTVQPFGNRLVTLTLSAQEVKDVLEEQFAGCHGQSPQTTRLLLPSAGFRYTWNGDKTCDTRVADVRLTTERGTELLVDETGKVLHPEHKYRVTVNSYLADGGDGFSTFRQGKDRLVGMIDIDALADFLAQYRFPALPYDPARIEADGGMPRLRRTDRGQVCPTGARTDS